MFGGRPITLFHVRGIRIAVDWSWFLILFLVIFWMSQFYEDLLGPGGSSSQAFLLAVLTAAGFFGSIPLHELGHAAAPRPPRRPPPQRNRDQLDPAVDLRRHGADGPRGRFAGGRIALRPLRAGGD